MEYAVELMHVDKKYGSFQALKDVSLTFEKGKVYGLIGKNGAGKTTMMRLMAGLSFVTSGTIKLFGSEDANGALSRMGTLIEYPSLNQTMSAKENMIYFYKLKGITVDKSLDELLRLVELDGTGKKKVKDFSLGMRQRLGIAVAVIGNPELLILDEPVNGLDPIGIVEMRNLIKRLSDEKKMTIIISSHNLPELYQTATDYIIIDKGQIVKEVTQEELEMCGKDNLEEYFISLIGGTKA